MYLKRHAEKTIKKLSKMFGAVMVTGPRQVGKTTLLQNYSHKLPYLTMDDSFLCDSAQNLGNTFFKDNPPPVFIDEIQKAPQLFSQIKIHIDKTHQKGLFFLSGSQQFQMMKNVSETLSGRIGLVNLLGLSLRELQKIRFDEPFVPSDEYIFKRNKNHKELKYDNFWELLHRGLLPELALNKNFDWQLYYAAYIRTYIERDVRQLINIGDEIKFSRFMRATAALNGQLLNLGGIAREVGISQPTAERWLSVLVASNIVYLLKPFYNNVFKRSVKTPKLYFMDSGLAAYLTEWNNPLALRSGAMAGHFFESFVISEIIKSYYNQGILEPPLYFYRDKDMKEIDLLIEKDGMLHPIEIKKHSDPSIKDIKSFNILDKIPNIIRGNGAVICMFDRLASISEKDKIIPVSYL